MTTPRPRFYVIGVSAYGREVFKVNASQDGQRPFTIARCDTEAAAFHIATLLNENGGPYDR